MTEEKREPNTEYSKDVKPKTEVQPIISVKLPAFYIDLSKYNSSDTALEIRFPPNPELGVKMEAEMTLTVDDLQVLLWGTMKALQKRFLKRTQKHWWKRSK